MKQRIHDFVFSSAFQNFIIVLILLNGITLGMETSPSIMEQVGGFLKTFDTTALGIFTIEIILKIYLLGWRFFKDPWNVFDFTIVTIALVPASGPFSVLRTLRILRLLRLITMVPQMRMIVSALLKVIPGVASIMMLVTIIFYIFAVLTTKLYGEAFPEWFGTLGESLYTLFQIMTLESWSMGIVRPVMEQHPYAWLVFISFILIATFVVINLIIAVLIDSINAVHEEDHQGEVKKHDSEHQELMAEIRGVKDQVSRLAQKIDSKPEKSP